MKKTPPFIVEESDIVTTTGSVALIMLLLVVLAFGLGIFTGLSVAKYRAAHTPVAKTANASHDKRAVQKRLISC